MAACESEVTLPGHRFVFDFGLTYYRTMRAFLADNRDRLLERRAAAQAAAAPLVAE